MTWYYSIGRKGINYANEKDIPLRKSTISYKRPESKIEILLPNNLNSSPRPMDGPPLVLETIVLEERSHHATTPPNPSPSRTPTVSAVPSVTSTHVTASTPYTSFSSSISFASPPFPRTLLRREMPLPRSLERIRELARQKQEAAPGERVEINRLIQKEREKFTYIAAGYGRVFDLQGNTIGKIHQEDSLYDFIIGNVQYVAGYRFDFMERLGGGISIRTTAYLNEDGQKQAEHYIVRSIRNEGASNYGHKRHRLSRSEAKRKMGYRHSFDVSVAGYNTHINTNGKIEIFTLCPQDLCSALVDGSGSRFQQYTRYSKFKKWIGETNQDVNTFVGTTFQSLAIVLNEIFF